MYLLQTHVVARIFAISFPMSTVQWMRKFSDKASAVKKIEHEWREGRNNDIFLDNCGAVVAVLVVASFQPLVLVCLLLSKLEGSFESCLRLEKRWKF